MAMRDEELRLECLRLAAGHSGVAASGIVAKAEELFQFVKAEGERTSAGTLEKPYRPPAGQPGMR